MTKAQVGHSAFDAESGMRGELSHDDDDGPRRDERFLRAGIAHCAEQVEILAQQLAAVSAKADEVQQWHSDKVGEAQRMVNDKRDELDALEDELDGLVG